MSMSEVEYLIEEAVKLIDTSQTAASLKRNLIWNAYQIQEEFDCGYTQFRVKDILLANDYFQSYDLKDFPTYADYPDYFDSLAEEPFNWVQQNPMLDASQDNPIVGYWDGESQKIYVEFGSPHYTLHPKESVNRFEPLDFGLMMVETADQLKCKSGVYDWTAFMIVYLLALAPSDTSLDDLKNDYFIKITSIFEQFDFSDYEPIDEPLNLFSPFYEEWLQPNQLALVELVTGKPR